MTRSELRSKRWCAPERTSRFKNDGVVGSTSTLWSWIVRQIESTERSRTVTTVPRLDVIESSVLMPPKWSR